MRGQHVHNLTGVDCPSCGSWGTTGIQYPSMDISSLIGKEIPHCHLQGYGTWGPMTVETLRELSKMLAPSLGPDRLLKPGAEFGPLRGRASGTCSDFAWLDPWTPLVRLSVFEILRKAGFDLVGVPAELTFDSKKHERLIELEIRPTARIHPSPPLRTCELCGRTPTYRGRGIDGPTYDQSIPLQRIREWPTRILANEALAEFVRDQGWAGVELKPIELKYPERNSREN